jgi:hypothetical protein
MLGLLVSVLSAPFVLMFIRAGECAQADLP